MSVTVPFLRLTGPSRGDVQRGGIALSALASHLVTDPRIEPTWDQLLDRMLKDLPAAIGGRIGKRLNDEDSDQVAQVLARHGPTFRQEVLAVVRNDLRLGAAVGEVCVQAILAQIYFGMVGTEFTISLDTQSPQRNIVIKGVTAGDSRSLAAARQQVDDALETLTDSRPLEAGEAAEIRRDVAWWYRHHLRRVSWYTLNKEYVAARPNLTADQRKTIKRGVQRADQLLRSLAVVA